LVFWKSSEKTDRGRKIYFQNEECENMNKKWLPAALLIAFLAAFVAATQIHGARASTTRSFTLYGAYLQGWGSTATSISSPGPRMVVEQGDTVNLTLISNDGITHRFFVSYTNSSSPSSGDPESADFSSTVNYQFVATNATGTYQYRCTHHPDVMWGYFQVVPTGTIPEFQPLMMLSVLVASTAVAALVYRRKRQI
jgi:FtsP/CotA-like multicopper oxidase with cupredoxin domain